MYVCTHTYKISCMYSGWSKQEININQAGTKSCHTVLHCFNTVIRVSNLFPLQLGLKLSKILNSYNIHAPNITTIYSWSLNRPYFLDCFQQVLLIN